MKAFFHVTEYTSIFTIVEYFHRCFFYMRPS